MEQPFTAYHPKPDGKGALVGNWVDERELHSLTETSRYEELTPAAFTENSVYPTQVKMKQAPTFKRVFEHTDNLAARDWKTHNSETFGEVQGQYQNSQKHGKRASREMAKLMELARQEPAEELKGLAYGARVMKTQDGGAVRRDRDFLVESGIMRPIDADRVVGDNHDQARVPDEPVTVYSETLEGGHRHTGVTAQHGGQVSAFSRDCNFSKPLSDYSKTLQE